MTFWPHVPMLHDTWQAFGKLSLVAVVNACYFCTGHSAVLTPASDSHSKHVFEYVSACFAIMFLTCYPVHKCVDTRETHAIEVIIHSLVSYQLVWYKYTYIGGQGAVYDLLNCAMLCLWLPDPSATGYRNHYAAALAQNAR